MSDRRPTRVRGAFDLLVRAVTANPHDATAVRGGSTHPEHLFAFSARRRNQNRRRFAQRGRQLRCRPYGQAAMRNAVASERMEQPFERGRRDAVNQHEHGSRRIDRDYALGLEHEPIVEKLQALDDAGHTTAHDACPRTFMTEDARRRREERSCSEQFLRYRDIGWIACTPVLPVRDQQDGNGVRFSPGRNGQRSCRARVRERRVFDENPPRTMCRDLREQLVQLYAARRKDLHAHRHRRTRACELCGVGRQDRVATRRVKARFMRRQYDREGLHIRAFAPQASDPREAQ